MTEKKSTDKVEKVKVMVYMNPDLVKRINIYRHKYMFDSRTECVVSMIEKVLKEDERKDKVL